MENVKIAKRIEEEIEKLSSLTQDYLSEKKSAQEMEKGILAQLLQIGKATLSFVIDKKSTDLVGYGPQTKEGEVLESKGLKVRKYLSLFGLFDITRPGHWSKERGNYYELDQRLVQLAVNKLTVGSRPKRLIIK